MHGLQACLFKYITVAAFHIYSEPREDAAKGEVGGHALNSHGNYIMIMENHGIVFLNFCGNPVMLSFISHPIFCVHTDVPSVTSVRNELNYFTSISGFGKKIFD